MYIFVINKGVLRATGKVILPRFIFHLEINYTEAFLNEIVKMRKFSKCVCCINFAGFFFLFSNYNFKMMIQIY